MLSTLHLPNMCCVNVDEENDMSMLSMLHLSKGVTFHQASIIFTFCFVREEILQNVDYESFLLNEGIIRKKPNWAWCEYWADPNKEAKIFNDQIGPKVKVKSKPHFLTNL